MIRKLTALVLSASSLLVASTASAQDTSSTTTTAPPPPPPVSSSSSAMPPVHPASIGIVVGFGINDASPSGSTESINAYGLGFGIRGGYTFPFRLYVGGTFIYHLGYSKDSNGATTTFRVNPIGAEVGYDFSFDKITVRPNLGIGLALYSASVSGGAFSVDSGGSKLAFWPGVLGTYDVTDNIFVGLDLRYTIVTDTSSNGGGSANAFGIYANLGYKF